jgi:hypothetical protein
MKINKLKYKIVKDSVKGIWKTNTATKRIIVPSHIPVKRVVFDLD